MGPRKHCASIPAPLDLGPGLQLLTVLSYASTTLSLERLASMALQSSNVAADEGWCVMRGACGLVAPRYDAALPCPYDGPPKEVTQATT
jgi:hypothetical protein